MGLTKPQADVLQALRDLTVDGVAPSFDEIKDRCGFATKSAVHRVLGRLEDRGFIRRIHYKARAIEIIDPDPLAGLSRDAMLALRGQIDRRLAGVM